MCTHTIFLSVLGRKIPFFERYLTRMSAASTITQRLLDKVSQLSSSLFITIIDEEEVTIRLSERFVSILMSHSCKHEYQTTLDYFTADSKLDRCEEDPDTPTPKVPIITKKMQGRQFLIASAFAI